LDVYGIFTWFVGVGGKMQLVLLKFEMSNN